MCLLILEYYEKNLEGIEPSRFFLLAHKSKSEFIGLKDYYARLRLMARMAPTPNNKIKAPASSANGTA